MIEFEVALLAIASAFVLYAIVSLYRVFRDRRTTTELSRST